MHATYICEFIGIYDWTARKEDNEIDYGGPHKHCYSCYSQNLCSRKTKSDDSCDYVKCPHFCGAFFHACKTEEHYEICPNVVTKCINYNFGCPMEMFRREINLHLTRCPASVLVCMAEWNREFLA